MTIRTRIFSAILAASLALSTLTAPAFEITAGAYTAPSISQSIPDISITDTAFINFTQGTGNFANNYIQLYDFCDDMYTGFGNNTSEISFVEMYFGIHAYVENNCVYFKFYNNCKQDFKASNPVLIGDRNKTKLDIKDLTNYSKIDTSELGNGLYKIEMTAVRKDNDKTFTPIMYFYVNGDETYLCTYTTMTNKRLQKYIDRRETVAKLIRENGITPENSLSTKSLCFPWHPSIGSNDIPKWTEFAKTIVKDEWSDSLKAFALREWMIKNLAYDNYKVNVLKTRRGSYYNDYSGKQDMYQTKTGVCFDFSNIYAAMCRSVGVPAVTIDTAPHTWNAIYISGRWYEVDLTVDAYRHVTTEDVTDVKISKHVHPYDAYCTLEVNNSTPEMINHWLMTYDKIKDYR